MPEQNTTPSDLETLKNKLEEEYRLKQCLMNENICGLCLQLLALKLYFNELVDAKFFWKGICAKYKESNPELGKLWKVGQALWNRDTAVVLKLVESNQWSETIAHIMKLLQERVRENTVSLVSKAYTSISIVELSKRLSLPAADVTQLAVKNSWEVDTNCGMVYPKRPTPESAGDSEIEPVSLESLTRLVSYLEN